MMIAPDELTSSATAPPARPLFRKWYLLAAVVVVGFPAFIFPSLPELDPSWMTALNLIERDGLIFGKDVIFTFGPLGFACHPEEVGSTWLLAKAAVVRMLVFGAFWWMAWLFLARLDDRRACILFAGLVALVGLDASMPEILLATITGCLVLAVVDRRPSLAILAALLSALGLFIKFNIAVAGVLTLAAWCVTAILTRSRREWIAVPFMALVYLSLSALLAVLSGMNAATFLAYLRDNWTIADVYSAQMTNTDDVRFHVDIVAVVVLLGTSLALAVAAIRRSAHLRAYVILFVPFFFIYKSCAVRSDLGHVHASALSLAVLVGFLLTTASPGTTRFRTIVTLACALGLIAILGLGRDVANGPKNLVKTLTWPSTRRKTAEWPRLYHRADDLPASLLAKIGKRSVDAYPDEISMLAAHGLNWRPRYMFQSYATYSPGLDGRDAEGFAGPNAPEFVLYQFRAIDHEHPFNVDSQTFRAIARRYRVIDQAGKTLLLERIPSTPEGPRDEIGRPMIRWGERWVVPVEDRGHLVLNLSIRPTRLGQLAKAFYKLNPPVMKVEYESGKSDEFRMVWKNADAGILVDELPEDLDDARRFLEGKPTDRVKAITFLQDGNLFADEVPAVLRQWSR